MLIAMANNQVCTEWYQMYFDLSKFFNGRHICFIILKIVQNSEYDGLQTIFIVREIIRENKKTSTNKHYDVY